MTLVNPTATTAASSTASTTTAITLPATINAGDAIYLFSSEQSTGPTMTWPAGFTDCGITGAGRTNLQLSAACKASAAGTEGGTSVTVQSSGSKQRNVIAVVWPGTGTFVGTGSTGASSTSVVSPSTAVAGNHYGVLAVGAEQSTTNPTWTPNAGYTEAAHIANALTASTALGVFYLADTGTTNPTGTITNVISQTANNWVSLTLVLPPSAGASVDASVTETATAAATIAANSPVSVTRTETATTAATLSANSPLAVTATTTATVSAGISTAVPDVGGLTSTQLEVNLNGAWTDVTAYARLSGQDSGIERGVGRGSEVDDSQPGYLAFTLDNIDGRFYPDSPTIRVSPGVTAPNPYYPYFTEDIQVRWHVNDGTSRLRFLGKITDLTPSWGGVMAADSTVHVTATDSLGQQSRGVLRSMIVQSQLASANLLSCYPIGEITGTAVAADVSGAVMPPLVVRAFGNGPGLSFGNTGPGVEGDLAATFGPKNASGYGKFLISVGGAKGTLAGLGYTIEAWFRLSVVGNGQYDIVGVASGDRTYSLSVQTSGTGGVAAGNTLVSSQTAPGFSAVSAASPAVGDGAWHHVALTHDIGGNLLSYYLDGVAWGSAVPLTLGDYRDLYVGGVIPNGPLILDGSVAAVACYNRPLSAAEVLAHAAAGLTMSVQTIAQQATAVAAYSGTSIAQEAGFGPQNAVPFKTAGLTPLDALLTVIRSEGGLVYDNGSGSYCRARSALKSSTVGITLDTEADLQGPPVLSRSTLAKVATVTATSSAGNQTVTDATALALLGAGASVTLDTSLADAVEIYSIASNRISQGLNRKTRLSQVVCDLNVTKNNLYAAMLTLQPGDRVRLTNLPSEFMGATYIDGYVLGWVERLGWDDGYTFTLDLIAADAPKELGFDTFRFASGDGVATGGTMTASATTVVITTAGVTWSINAGDYPMDVDYNGERITLTSAPGGTTSPQSFTGVTRGVAPTVARAHTSGEPIDVADAIRFAF